MAMRKAKSRSTGVARRNNVVTSENDNFAAALKDLVPERFKDTDRYLNLVQWNIEWFGASKSQKKDEQRRKVLFDVFRALNADIFVLQEIAGPSSDGRYPGALDPLAQELSDQGAGEYVVFYTKAGGEQRVAMMYDRQWLRAKSDIEELFPRGTYQKQGQKDPFAGRTPLYGFFTGKVPAAGDMGAIGSFDFQVLGVHLKAMGDGHPQRRESAEVLAEWMTAKAPTIDSDILIVGDWNAAPDDVKSWKPFHDMENAGKLKFRGINDPSDISYLWMENLTTKFGSHIDLTAMSLSSERNVVGKPAQVIKWKPIEEALGDAGTMKDARVREVLKIIKENVSDHLPTATRFYFRPGE